MVFYRFQISVLVPQIFKVETCVKYANLGTGLSFSGKKRDI